MRKLSIPVVIVIALIASFSLVMAQGLPGSGWESGQQIQNIADSGDAMISFIAYDQSGNDTDCGSQMAGPGGSVNYLTGDCAVPAGFQGSAVVSADLPIAAIVNVNNRTVGAAAGQYQGTDGSDVASTISFPLVKHNFGARTTTFYVQNASGDTNTITATFTTGPGVGQPTTERTHVYNDVPPYAMVVVSPADASVPSGDLGSLVVEGTQPLAGTSLEHQHTAAVAANMQASKAFTPNNYDSTAYCPLVRHGHTANNQTTGIQAQNVSGVPQAIQVEYAYSIGGGPVQTASVTSPVVADGESFTFFGADATYGLPNGALGSATVSGVDGGNIAVVVNDRAFALNPTRVTTYACFSAGAATDTVSIPLYKEYFFGNTSGIQVQNVSGDGTAVIVELVYTDTNGNSYTISHTDPIADGASKTFFGVSQGTAPSDITGANPALVNTFGGVVVTSNAGSVVAIANESSFGGFGTTPSGQDTKNYEGFNK